MTDRSGQAVLAFVVQGHNAHVVQRNLQGANAALVSTEAALADVGNLLASLRSEALGVVDTISTDTQREAVINTIDGLLLDLQRVELCDGCDV